MKFEELYNESIELWPTQIDVSDGKPAENGILFKNLSFIWNHVEAKANSMSEWADLMSWIMFKSFHSIAKKNFQSGIKIVSKSEIDIEKVKEDLIDNLRTTGYEDMLKEFERNNTDV